MNVDLLDHGIPLISLKEQRRELVVAMIGRTGPLSTEEIQQIAALQQAITAIEAVIVDLDAEELYPEAVVTLYAAH